MKYIKIYEDFSDIDSICKRYSIENYTINDDGSIDVDDHVNLIDLNLSKLPLKFRNVGGDFECNHNKLVTLEGCPESVGGYFNCGYNQLLSLEGYPKSVGDGFNCYGNPIYYIYKLFRTYNDFELSMDYNYLRGTNIDKVRFQEALDEFGIDIPEKIEGYNYI